MEEDGRAGQAGGAFVFEDFVGGLLEGRREGRREGGIKRLNNIK